MRLLMPWAGCIGLAFAWVMAGCSPQADPAAGSPQPAAPASQTPPAPTPEPEASSPAVYRGSALARQVCVQCHDIGVPGTAPATDVGAPGFSEVANRPDMTAEYLVQWMRSTHPTMPGFMFDAGSVADVTAYILDFRLPRSTRPE